MNFIPEKMSSRALRRLKGKQRGQEALDMGSLVPGEEQAAEVEEEEGDSALQPISKSSNQKAKKNKSQKNLSNIYELVKYLDSALAS